MYKKMLIKTFTILLMLVMCVPQLVAAEKMFMLLSSLDGDTEIVNAKDYEVDSNGDFFVDHKLLAGKLGITSTWDESNKQVTFKSTKNTLILSESKQEIFIKDNKVYSPIKKVTEAMGYITKLDAKSNALYLRTITKADLPSYLISKKKVESFTINVMSKDYFRDNADDWYIRRESNKLTLRGDTKIDPEYKFIIHSSIALSNKESIKSQFDEVEALLRQNIDEKTVTAALKYAKMKKSRSLIIFPKLFISDKYVIKVHSADYNIFIDVCYKTPQSTKQLTRFGSNSSPRFMTFQEDTTLKSGIFSIQITKGMLYNKYARMENSEKWVSWLVTTKNGLDIEGWYERESKAILVLTPSFLLRETSYDIQCKDIEGILKPVLSEKTVASIMNYATSKVNGSIRKDNLEIIDGKYRIDVHDNSEPSLEVIVYYK